MALFPQFGPQYYDERDNGIKAIMEASYAEAITLNLSFWGLADTASRACAGDCTIWQNLYGNLPGFRRNNTMGINMIRPIINMISGQQRKTRKSTIVTPVENADAETADQFTKILYWINNQEDVLGTISDSFQGSLITGMNMLHVWVDYRSDPISGNIKVDNCSYNSFLIDPFFRKQDLSDCNYIWKRSYLTKRECISLYPDKAEEIMGLIANDSRDGKFQFQPESYSWGVTNLLSYDEYYYRDYRNQKMLVDTETGESMEWTGKDEDLEAFLASYPQVTVLEQTIPTVKLAVVIQGKVFYDGPNPTGSDRYPFVPVFAYYNEELPYLDLRIQGVVASMLTPQYLYNRFVINMCDILESQINSGYIAKENSLVNPNDLYMAGNGKTIFLKEEAQMTDLQKISPGEAPQSMFSLTELFNNALFSVSGVTKELIGASTEDISGYHAMLKMQAGLTGLETVFDNLNKAQKLLGDLFLDIIRTNYTPGKIKKILEGKEPSPQFYSKAFGKYSCVVEEGFDTATQQQMQFAQILDLRAAGVPIPDEQLLKSATIQNKKEIIDEVTRIRQAQEQAQQMQMQAAMQEQQARTELSQARAVADKGLGLERVSRVEENHALAIEREAAAEKDKEIGFLNLVKALKEIDGIDLAHIEKLLSLANMVKMQEQQASEVIDSSVRPEKNKAADLLSGLENSSLKPQEPQQQQQPMMG